METKPTIRIVKKENMKMFTGILSSMIGLDCFFTMKRKKLLISDVYKDVQKMCQYFSIHESLIHTLYLDVYNEISFQLLDVKKLLAVLRFGNSKGKSLEIQLDVPKNQIKVVAESGFPTITFL